MTIRELVRKGQERLQAAGIENARNEARYLLEAKLAVDRSYLFLHDSDAVTAAQQQEYLAWIDRRATHVPMQYILGIQEFMGLSFRVNAHVLIPRQDTEILVETAMRYLSPDMQILDLCCGSGCIGISLSRLADVKVCLADISAQALEVAGENVRLHAQDDKITLVESDLLTAVTGRYDMIVSNPPYIKSAEIPTLMEEVRDHEPLLALDGREDGLYYYRRIVHQAGDYLRDGGYLLFEIGYDQAEAVRSLLAGEGYQEIQVLKDLAGLDRVVLAKYVQDR